MAMQSLACSTRQISKIQSWLSTYGCQVRHNLSKYVSWSGTLGRNYITLYTSGKIVFDTKDQFGAKLLADFEKKFIGSNQKIKQKVSHQVTLKYSPKERSKNIVKKGVLATSKTAYCIALDESGTGEAFGQVILSGCLISKNTQLAWQDLLQKVNTKGGGKKGEDYWFEQQAKISDWQKKNETFNDDRVAIEYKNITFALENKLFTRVGIKNKLMDKYYEAQIIKPLLREYKEKNVPLSSLTIIIDNYSLGKSFKDYLQDLESEGVTVIITTKADDLYVAVRLAAIEARIQRACEIRAFNETGFMVGGVLPGNGNLSIPQTKKWLRLWWLKHHKWPWFVKQWFKPTQVISNA